MPITLHQIAVCTQTKPGVLSRFVRDGMLKAKKKPNGIYDVEKEDLADFFISHPEYWRRFLSSPQQKKYMVFHELMRKTVRQKTGKSGPLYYKTTDLDQIFGLSHRMVLLLIRNGKLSIMQDGKSYYIEENSMIDFLKQAKHYRRLIEEFQSTDRWLIYLRDRLLYLLKEEDNK